MKKLVYKLAIAGLVGGLALSACRGKNNNPGGASDIPEPTQGSPNGGTNPPSPAPPAPPIPTGPTGPNNIEVSAVCRQIGDGTGIGNDGCGASSEQFPGVVAAAVDAARGLDIFGDNGKVDRIGEYLRAVTENLNAAGYCGYWDGKELLVKNSNASNDQYNILTSDGGTRALYKSSCYPATKFTPHVPNGNVDTGCDLARSTSFRCAQATTNYRGDVEATLDEMIAEDRARTGGPVIFQFGTMPNVDYLPGVAGGWKVVDSNLYTETIVRKMREKGYCAINDGEEFAFKKGTNDSNEQWDLLKAEGFSIRSYKVHCFDATF